MHASISSLACLPLIRQLDLTSELSVIMNGSAMFRALVCSLTVDFTNAFHSDLNSKRLGVRGILLGPTCLSPTLARPASPPWPVHP
ncbi:hypothetical protein BDZ89DRAFT_243037 [Hymenopellis radicata]|nr:hypothetical protein BDZ89DRAFT_243037 [Hymenopellis radicata]